MFYKSYFKIAYRHIFKQHIFIKQTRHINTLPKLTCRSDTHISNLWRGHYSFQNDSRFLSKYRIHSLFNSRVFSINTHNKESECNGSNKTNIERPLTSSTNSNQVVEEFYYVDNEENRESFKLYPSPKNTLNNVYTLVSQETKNNSHLTSSFKSVQDKRASKWICTYKLSWPVEIKFLAKDATKKVASHKAALAALTWLRKQNKITKNGFPVIYDNTDIKRLTKDTIQNISLDTKHVEAMDNIVKIYQEQMKPFIDKCPEVPLHLSENKLVVDKEHELDHNNIEKKFLGVERYQAKEKIDLPISSYKEKFIEILRDNQVLIVKGEPGCGKSTRIPQYVLEAWAREDGLLGKTGMIAVTQPRRIAAISLAERVCKEREELCGYIVGYQVRFNNSFRPKTGRILYCTTGILLRHVQSDNTLSKFSHVILDEAHERDVNTDLLMNLLKISLKNNPSLKVIVMSATINTGMFGKYFDDAPIMEIPGFTYPVKRYFTDSVKVVDLTKTESMCAGPAPAVIHDDVVKVIQYIHNKKSEGAILCFLPGWEDITKVQRLIPQRGDSVTYCLHSRLNDTEQFKIFSKPPPGIRKIILATNIAETSITIDDVVYVIDTGVQKEQRFDSEKGIKCVDNHWISKANAVQRSGRAGRVQPGECYHLYNSSKYDSFEEYSIPEIMRTSLTKIVLDSKAFSNNMDTFQFMRSLPSPPEEGAISRAVKELKDIELLDENENLTSLGRTVAEFQLEPKLSKTLVNSYVFMCLSPIIDIVTMFSTDTELFSTGLIDKETVKSIKSRFSKDSDHLALMRIFEKYLEFDENDDFYGAKHFCEELNLVFPRMGTLKKLRAIHMDYLKDGLHKVMPLSDQFSDNDEFVKAVLYSGIGNILQYRNWDLVKNRLKSNKTILLTRNNHKATITPESVNYRRTVFPSNYLFYINETRSNVRRTTLVRECSMLSDLSVLLFSNKNLKVSQERDIDLIEKENKVKLALEDTTIEFACDKEIAEKILKCKKAIKECYGYYISQLTSIGENNEDVNNSWSDILQLLNKIIVNKK